MSSRGFRGDRRAVPANPDDDVQLQLQAVAQRRERRLRREDTDPVTAIAPTSTSTGSGSSSSTGRHSLPTEREKSSRASTPPSTPSGQRHSAPSSTSTEINHQDEIERIREMRARRLRKERAEAAQQQQPTPVSQGTNSSPTAGESNARIRTSSGTDTPDGTTLSTQERRAERQHQRQARPTNYVPTRTKSTPVSSRRELEDSANIRRERRLVDAPLTHHSQREEDTSAPSAAYSRSRRERIDRLATATDDDVLSAYSRARRERLQTTTEAEEDAVMPRSQSHSRLRKERDRDRVVMLTDEDSANHSHTPAEANYVRSRSRRAFSKDSASDDNNDDHGKVLEQDVTLPYSRSSERLTARLKQASNRKMELLASAEQDPGSQDSIDDKRQHLSRSNSGGEDLSLLATNRAGQQRRPPARAKSADQDLLAMDLRRRNEDETKGPRNTHTDAKRDAQPTATSSRTPATDLTARLRERREARAAEKEIKTDQDPSADRLGMEVERRLARRRSNEGLYQLSAASMITAASPTPTSMSLRNVNPKDENGATSHLELDTLLSDNHDNAHTLSIKVQIVSAIDLPLNVVANMPLCPVVKIGFVRIPHHADEARQQLQDTFRTKSIATVRSCLLRSTTTKIMGKRDNGTIDFHQEMRWDGLTHPTKVALVVEIAARAVRTPTNYHESPPAIQSGHIPKSPQPTKRIHSIVAASTTSIPKPALEHLESKDKPDPVRNLQRNSSGSEEDLGGGFRALWRKATSRKAAELEAAEAAAAVARMLVEQDKPPTTTPSTNVLVEEKIQDIGLHQLPVTSRSSVLANAEIDVSLRQREKGSEHWPMTEDARLGTLVIPLAQLPLEKILEDAGSAKLEKWFQLGEALEADLGLTRMKQPSVRLDIACSHPQTMNEAEDNIDFKNLMHNQAEPSRNSNASIPQRTLEDSNDDPDDASSRNRSTNSIDPLLEPGVLDFIAVVGCKDIGKHSKVDNGVNGWVEASPECSVLEQFPPSNEFHARHGRKALLPEMVQWFCFPEGARLWRGTAPPSHLDLNLKRFSASSPPNVASSIAAFDACLNCTTSFSWFVIASNSDEYGSKLVKTYGAVIRFFSPAPNGADSVRKGSKRLWVPMGICLTSNLPIIGVMEAMLLRLCEDLASRISIESRELAKLDKVHEILAKVIVAYQKPIAGAVNCSIPFIDGERFLLSLPPPSGLPPLPHGKAIVSACRLLGAEGLNFLLASVLTECKVLIHSQDIADIAMVAEVVTALIYPFSWSLPYIPILPVGMLEFVEAPLSYILGVPTHNLRLIDRNALEDVVVIDLDKCSTTPSFVENRRSARAGTHRNPPPLPSQVAANISRAVYKLLRAEEELDAELGLSSFGDQTLPRLEGESLAEREFRVAVAIEVCGLLRGYQECTGPVFNRDKFLKTAPALFEDRKDQKGVVRPSTQGKVISPRSKRFLSVLVNTQNFQQFLESVDSGEVSFFHEIIEILEDPDKIPTRSGDTHAIRSEKSLAHLVKNLQKAEDHVSTYQVDNQQTSGDMFNHHDDFYYENDCDMLLDGDFTDETETLPCTDPDLSASFTDALLQPCDNSQLKDIEQAQWQYREIFNIVEGCTELVNADIERIRLSVAIGERKYREWKAAQDQKERSEMGTKFTRQSIVAATKQGAALDLTTLISSVSNSEGTDDVLVQPSSHVQRQTASNPEQQRIVDAKDRDIIRRCLDRANGENNSSNPFIENGRDLLAESEKALRNPSAQRFLLSILSQRSRMETQRLRLKRGQAASQQASVSRLDPVAFNCLVRLSCAILDSCMEYEEFETAYRLLTLAAGFIMWSENKMNEASSEKDATGQQVVTMTSSIGLHPIFANLSLWETVMKMHLVDRRSGKKSENRPSDIVQGEETDEEDDEMEYESATATLFDMKGYDVPGEELSRFAMRISEKNGWFSDDRGRQLLVLARRITLRRDMAGESTPLATDSSIEMMARSQNIPFAIMRNADWEKKTTADDAAWKEIAWCHPAAPTSQGGGRLSDSAPETMDTPFMKRSPITALASFGHSVVVTGGLDGSIFLAYSINGSENTGIRGIHLDWGSASRAGGGFSSDGEYGVGAVSCIAAAFGGGQHVNTPVFETKRELSSDDVAEVISLMDGSRVVAGTTAGDLRVWSVNDVLSSLHASKSDDDSEGNAKSALTRLKFSLRGRALAGHRGGVTAIDVPSQIYRPDSLVTGGADGLIKLWSLRSPTTGRRATAQEQDTVSQQRGRGGDALSVLSGHNGRVAVVKTAWHGDRLLSGGADHDLRIWDLASGGKCSHVLSGHSSWVTHIESWGSNTILSGSADRTLSLWDPRVAPTPLFVLRYHKAPITDILVGSRTDPLMVSAAADGTIATWDFRVLSQWPDESKTSLQGRKSKSIREPKLSVVHSGEPTKRSTAAGQVLLCRSILNPETSVLSIGPDAIVREWDKIGAGTLENQSTTHHCDSISGFLPCRTGTLHDQTDYRSDGIITSSLDGTVRMRRLASRQST